MKYHAFFRTLSGRLRGHPFATREQAQQWLDARPGPGWIQTDDQTREDIAAREPRYQRKLWKV